MLGLTPEKLRTFQPISTHLYTIVDEGIEWAKSVAKVGDRRIKLSQHGLANLLRIYVCDCLKQTDRSRMPYERVDLLNDGVEIQCLEHSIKVTKVPKVLRAAYDFLPLSSFA